MNKREEDFEKSAMDYCEDHSHCIYFEAGAEYGYQYAFDKVLAKVQELYPQAAAYYEQPDVFVEQIRKAMQ